MLIINKIMYVNEKLNCYGSIPSRPLVDKGLPSNWKLFYFGVARRLHAIGILNFMR